MPITLVPKLKMINMPSKNFLNFLTFSNKSSSTQILNSNFFLMYSSNFLLMFFDKNIKNLILYVTVVFIRFKSVLI